MNILIVYEDQTPYNPIRYAGIIDRYKTAKSEEDALREEVEKAIRELEIESNKSRIDEIVYDLMGISNFHWEDECWCFSVRPL